VPSRAAIPDKMPRKARYTLAQSSNFIPVTAALYDAWRERSLSWLTREAYPLSREYALMLEWLNVQPGQQFLDVGTSTGNYARALADAGATVTAIDISRPMLEKAVSRSSGYDAIAFEQVNVEALPYPDSSFDGVVVGASLNEFHDTQLALREMARVLKPDGKLFMMYLRQSDTALGRFSQAAFQLSGVRFPNRDQLKTQLEALGLIRTRAEVRRAIALELFVRTVKPSASDLEEHRKLARAAGKPAKEPLH
jgi:SAM-dependent methyltransferase